MVHKAQVWGNKWVMLSAHYAMLGIPQGRNEKRVGDFCLSNFCVEALLSYTDD